VLEGAGETMNYSYAPLAPVIIGTREQIIDRVATILSGMSGAPPLYRNRGDFEDIQRPAIVVLDGIEKNISSDQESIKTRRMVPATILMSPQIFVLLKERDNATNDTVGNVPDPVGAEINFWLDAIRGALSNDALLLQYLTPNGQVIYRGCWTDMQTGSTLIGELRVFIDLVYVWLPPA
jgi:hypothetical protein